MKRFLVVLMSALAAFALPTAAAVDPTPPDGGIADADLPYECGGVGVGPIEAPILLPPPYCIFVWNFFGCTIDILNGHPGTQCTGWGPFDPIPPLP